MQQDKKMIAALSGVMAILSSESQSTYIEPKRGNYPEPWTAVGKTTTMQYRDLTQRRLLKRTR